MESPSRASQTSLPSNGENNGSTPLHPESPNVVPINSVPYTVPSLLFVSSTSPDINTDLVPVEVDSKHTSSQQHVGPLGLLDVAESEDNYLFRVSLSGLVRHEKVFFCDAGPDEKINIRGVSELGKNRVRRGIITFKMQTQTQCIPEKFSLTFQLPGPIDHQNVNCNFRSDGIFEGVVKKKKISTGP